MIHIELHDSVSVVSDKELARIKLHFIQIPGVEASFADKSLLYNFDGELFCSKELKFVASSRRWAFLLTLRGRCSSQVERHTEQPEEFYSLDDTTVVNHFLCPFVFG